VDRGLPDDAAPPDEEVCPLEWECATDAVGRIVCQTRDPLALAGLPAPEGSWQCHMIHSESLCEWPVTPPEWLCAGELPAAADPPGGCGWECEEEGRTHEKVRYRCRKPVGPEDAPPGEKGPADCLPFYRCTREPEAPPPEEGCFVCVKGSAFGGTRCTLAPNQAGWPQTKYTSCLPGQKRWCSGLDYDGWGTVECDPETGRWLTKLGSSGQEVLDCHSRSDGRRPSTLCACYHFYFNAACCERPDCIVPEGSAGQLCPASAGQLCDYCTPSNPECAEEGSRCVITNRLETFCGRVCEPGDPGACPRGYRCEEYKMQAGVTHQCIPEDLSCYF
jgi:hypothetical protein